MTVAEQLQAARLRHDKTLRALSIETGYSYEHVRRVLSGAPVASRHFVNEISKALGLDPVALWELARKEKVLQRYGYDIVVSEDARLLQVWALLTFSQRQALYSIALELLKARQISLETVPK